MEVVERTSNTKSKYIEQICYIWLLRKMMRRLKETRTPLLIEFRMEIQDAYILMTRGFHTHPIHELRSS